MKANELQIGDYVNWRGQIIKVTSLYDKCSSNEVGWGDKEIAWVNADNVESILLTPEILEKNGFEVRNRYIWERKDNYCCVKLNIAPKIEIDGEILDEYPPILLEVDGATFNLNIIVEYVHELQHALKLCGIDKTIEL